MLLARHLNNQSSSLNISPLWLSPPCPSSFHFCCFIPPVSLCHLSILGLSQVLEGLLSAGTAKCCWARNEAGLLQRRSCQKVSKTASVQTEAVFFFFFFLSSWDYFLCAEHTRDRRAPQREARRGFSSILLK